MTSQRVVYMNGEFVPEPEARISIYDSALMFGDMVFEMTRSFNKVQFKLREHLERLYLSMRYLQIPTPMTIEEMESLCQETVERNEPSFALSDEHRLMINVSRGPLSIYAAAINSELKPTVVIADFPLSWTVAGMGHLFDVGINAVVPSQRAIPSHLLDAKVKNRSRVHYMMANIEVSNWKGSDNWALLLDPDGFVTEGTGANFFTVKDGVLSTPGRHSALRGISRAYIFELADQLGLHCSEKDIDLYDVLAADEAFMTATPFCMLPVTKLNGQEIGTGEAGSVTTTLLGQWSTNVGVDIAAQIKEYSTEIADQKSNGAGATPYRFAR